MDEEDKKMVLSALRATVASSQGGVELQALNSDYRELEGQNIPFKALGFSSLEAYIRSLSDHFMIVSKHGSLHVLAKKNEALAHIQDMISSQRVKKKPARKGKVSRGKYGNYSTSFNNRHPPKPATFSGSSNSFRRNGSNNKPSRPTYPAGSKPWSSSHDYRSASHDYRSNSPVRRRSPPRSRIEPTTSTARKQDPPPAEVATRRKESIRVPDPDKLPANIQKMPEYHHKKTEESAVYRPPVVSNLVSKMMSQIRVNDDMSHINTARQDPMLNLQITLPNDLYTPPAGLNMYQRLPTAAPPIYSHPPPMDPHQVYTPSFRSPLSPSYSMQNGATSSKSSSPEVYLELPPGATPEEQLTHVCKYLYNDEPGIVIRDRKPDPKRPVFTYYAFIQVGSHSRISTLPNEFSTKEEAKSSVITLALNQLNKLKDERMSKTLKKTTDKLNLLIDRIYSLACDSSNGMVASKIEELYEAKYGEILPDDWTQNPEVLNHPRLEVNRNPISTIIYAKTVQMPQYSASASLPPLQLPEENEWPVFVSMMPSVSNVFVRLADDACDDYFKMCEDLDKFMSEATRPAPVPGVEVGELYCLNDDSVWHRVRVESADEQIVVKMIDHGEEGPRAIQELYPLYDMFRTIPAQAIELYLPECQVFAEHFDHSEVEREIVGKTLVAVIQSRETLTATLYNTAEDPNVNINHFIFDQICGWFNESSLPEENMFNGSVFVSFISTNENCIYVQVESLMFQYLTNSIRELITTSDVQEYVVKSTAALTDCREDIFLAKYDLDGEYYRASLLDVNPISNNVSVRFIDYGNTSLVSCTNLIKLFETSESHLCLIPAQAKEVKLVGLEHFTPDVMNKLTTYVNGTEPVMLKMTAGRAQLHKRDHDGKIVNINALVLGSPLNTSGFKGSPYKTLANYKEFDASPLEPPTIPPLNHMIDVLVETVVSPSNFWIRPQESYNKWVDLVEEMEEFYSEQDKTLKPTREHIKVGASFAFYYEELELWQRVTINSQISPECVALFLVDFGKIITANTSELQYLAPQFRKLPAIAIKSKLHDIKPAFGDWNPEDILRFQQMCDPIKVFKCRIENCTPDLISHKEDVQLSVRLLDTHHSDVDLDLSVVLVVEGRAKMND